MSDVKIGFSQTNKPSPLGYRKFMNLYIVAVIPAATTLIMSIGLPESTQKIALVVLGFSATIVKGLDMVLGNGQVYSPSNEAVENQSSKN